MRTTIRIDKTVAEEVTIARCVYAEVTSVGPVFSSILIFLEKTLVYPVPDISTLEIRIFVNCLPLSPQVSRGVSHGMCILRRSYRTVATILSDIFQPVGTRILRNIHIGVPFPLGTFVVDRTVHDVFIGILDPKVSLVEVITVAGFVTQRPESQTRIVLITFEHVDCAIHVRFQPFRIVSQRTAFSKIIVHAMALDVCFIVYIKSVFVAQFVETAILRIMAQANRIQVVLFHQFEIFAHQLFSHIVTGSRVMFVNVHSLQLQRLSVDEEAYIGLSVACQLLGRFNFDAAETYVERNDFVHFTVFFYCHHQLVEVGGFRSPGLYIRKCLVERHRTGLSGRYISCFLSGCHYFAIGIEQFVYQRHIAGCRTVVSQVYAQFEDTVFVCIVQSRCYTEIFERGFGL